MDEVRADETTIWLPPWAQTWTTVRWIWAAVLLVWLVLIYSPSFSGPYVFDDLGNVINNPAIESFPPKLAWWRAESRPLVMASFALEKQFFGAWPFAHRLSNVLIHWVSAILFAELLYRICDVAKIAASKSMQISFAMVVATVWAVHPLQSQAVAYIVQRCESMMGLFFIAFLLSIVVHHQTSEKRWLLIGAVCFLLGLWSKTVMVTGLAVGPLMDRAWLCHSWREVFRRRAALYLPPLVAGIVAVFTLLPGILRGDANVGFGGDAPPVLPYIAAQAEIVPRYLALVLVPIGLNIDHGLLSPYPWQDSIGWMIAMGGVVLGGVVACARGNWKLGFLVLSPLLVLAPTSSFVPTADLLVEHRMYIPSALVITAIAIALWRIVESRNGEISVGYLLRGTRPSGASHKRYRTLISLKRSIVAGSLVVMLLSTMTWLRSADYQSGVRLWSDSLRLSPGNARAAQNLTNAAKSEDREDELLSMFVAALETARHNEQPTAVILGRIGEELVKRGGGVEAVAPLTQAIAQDPETNELSERFYSPSQRQEFASHHVNLALAFASQRQADDAMKHLRLSFEISDTSPEARAIAGDLAWQIGITNEAIEHFQRALQLRPDWPQVKQQLNHIIQTQAESPRHAPS